MLDQKIAQEVIDCALSTGGDFAEIFYEDRLNNGVMMRSGKVESINSGRLHGAGVRVYLGLRGVYVYTNDTTREGLLACARRAASALHADSRVTAQPLRATEYVNCHPIAILPSQVKTARKIEKMRAAQGVLSQYDEVVQGMIRYTDSEQRVWIANSDGLYTSDTRVYTRMSISAIASNGTENQTGTSNPGALQGFEIFDSRIDPEAAALLAESAGTNLGRIAVETDKMLKNLPEGAKQITISDIERNVGISREFSVFELTKELSARNGAKALRIAARIGEAAKFAMPMAVSALYTHFARILKYAALKEKNRYPDRTAVAAALQGVNPYFWKEYDIAVANYPVRKAMEVISLLCEYDYKGKGGDAGEATPGELLVELTSKILSI